MCTLHFCKPSASGPVRADEPVAAGQVLWVHKHLWGGLWGDSDPVQRKMIMGARIWGQKHVHKGDSVFNSLIKNKRLCLLGPGLGNTGHQTEGWGQGGSQRKAAGMYWK